MIIPFDVNYIILLHMCQTQGPRATSGPPPHFMWPARAHKEYHLLIIEIRPDWPSGAPGVLLVAWTSIWPAGRGLNKMLVVRPLN